MVYCSYKISVTHKLNILGPLTYDYNGTVFLAGIVSLGFFEDPIESTYRRSAISPGSSSPCIKTNGTYSVFARVTAQLKWIKKEIKNKPKTCQI